MPALTLKGDVIDLSYTYDALTVYPKLQDTIGDVVSCVSKCSAFGFVMKAPAANLGQPTKQAVDLNSCFSEIDSSKGVQRYIHRYDDDHDLYHQDTFPIEDRHAHLKFYRSLTRDQLSQVMDVFEEADLIIKEQKEAFMTAFDTRYADLRATADSIFSQKEKEENASTRKKKTVESLLGLIATCKDNDKLVNLHAYLAESKFDYLRVISEEHSSKEWQGTNRTGAVVKTSKAWSGLEKAISLRMIKNLQEQSLRFTPDFGKERSAQLTNSHRFFGIKRTRPLLDPNKVRTYKTLDAFSKADEATLDRKYKKAFKL